MDKNYEAIKEILEDEIKKIVKKGDISPQELDNLYKASAICLDFETKEAMKKAEKSNSEKSEYSQRGNSYEGHSNEGYSTHYPWYMPGFRSFDGKSYFDNSNDMQSNRTAGHSMGGSYEQPNRGSYDSRGSYESSYDGQGYENSNDYSERGSYRRGRDARTGRYVSRDGGSYDYSRHDEKERMLDRLEMMLDNASTEKDRRAIEQCIDRISR